MSEKNTSSTPAFPIETNYNWDFPLDVRKGLAEYACEFAKPFWADFTVDGGKRTVSLPDATIITETLFAQRSEFYIYNSEGVPGISEYQGLFGIAEIGEEGLIRLTWATSFQADTSDHMMYMLEVNARAVPVMTERLKEKFPLIPTHMISVEE